MKKVLLILIDGLRPDAIEKASHSFLNNFMHKCTYSKQAGSVFPSVTLPCHMSVFHSVTPERHGVMENTYMRPVHKLDGIFEVLARNGKKCQFFYTWEELRDLGRPGSLARQEFCSWSRYGKDADCRMCSRTIEAINNDQPDFVFYYTGHTDEMGHKYGWMSPEYMEAVDLASENVQNLIESLPEEYDVIITADHGGHDRVHGTRQKEDMVIPMMFYGKEWEQNREMNDISLLDIAPTVADLLNCPIPDEWEGKSLVL